MTASRALPALRAILTLALACILLTMLGRSSARADAQALPAGYTALIDEAVAEATRGNFLEARALFARAHAVYPNARTLRGLGMMAYELRSYTESISYYEQALSSQERPLDKDLRADAEAQLARARRFVAEIKLALTPPATRLTVDNMEAAPNAAGLLRLDPGQHTLVFEAAGYRSETRSLNVRGGENLVWTITLSLAESAPKVAQTEAPIEAKESGAQTLTAKRADESRPLLRNPWLWTGVVLAVGAITAGVVIGVTRHDGKKTLQEEPTRSAQTPDNGVIFTLVRR